MKETIGRTIRRLRKERGFTQDKLAEMVGVTFQAVSKWENDIGMPDISQVVPLARIFGVTTDELFGYSESEDKLRLSKLEEQYNETFKSEDIEKRIFVCEQAVQEYPGDMHWLNNYAWALWMNAACGISDDDQFNAERKRVCELFRKVIENTEDIRDKKEAITGIVQCLKGMGKLSEALQYAELYPKPEQGYPDDWREKLIISCMTGEEKTRKWESFLKDKLHGFINHFDMDDPDQRGVCQRIIEVFFPAGDYYEFCSYMVTICLADARAKIVTNELDEAMIYMKKARQFAIKSDTFYQNLKNGGRVAYNVPIFKHIEADNENFYDNYYNGNGTELENFIALLDFPAYAPLKSHPYYNDLAKR